MNESIHLGRIGGIRVGLNWSLLPIAALFAWSLASGQLPYEVAGYPRAAYWLAAVLTTLTFFASLLAHELAHALVARRRRVPVDRIVLWLLGGVAEMQSDPPDPRSELMVAGAGPLASLAVGGVVGGLAWGLSSLALSPLLVACLAWLAGINVLLAVFNLLPALPLDGGRLLRAVLWRIWGDRARATGAAARTARVIGGGLIGLGAAELLLQGSLEGAWIALIGWFIFAAAGQEQLLAAVPARPAGPRVADAMSHPPVVLRSDDTLADVHNRYLRRFGFSSFPVVDSAGGLVGLALVRRMNEVPGERWWVTNVMDASARPGEILVCGPWDSLGAVTGRLAVSPDRTAVVLDGGRPVGVLSYSDAVRVLNRQARLEAALAGAGR